MNDLGIRSIMEDSPHCFNESVEYQLLFYEVVQQLQGADQFLNVYPDIEHKLRVLLKSERVIVYKRGRHRRELSAYAQNKCGTSQEIRLDFSPDSIAGYVALAQKPVCVRDVTNPEALTKIHPSLCNDEKGDRLLGFKTRSTMAVPIFHGAILIGVMQLINRREGRFSPSEYKKLKVFADMLGNHFYEELGVTEGPYDFLVQQDLLTPTELELHTERERATGVSVGYALLAEGKIPRETIGRSLASFYQVPFASLNFNARIPSKLIAEINPNYIKRQGWIPIAEDGKEVTILIDDPSDSDKNLTIENLFRGRKVKMLLMLREEIAEIAERALEDNGAGSSLEQLTHLAASEVSEQDAEANEFGMESRDSNVVRLIDRLIDEAYGRRASDIHIQPAPSGKMARILFRIDGVCRQITCVPQKLIRPLVSRLKVICSMDLAERRLPQDGRCTMRVRNQEVEIRAAVIPNATGLETAVLRLQASSEAMHIFGLDLSPCNLQAVQSLLRKKHGLILVVGPTGSGKTTTLHSLTGQLNDGEKVIWTVEDPVEISQPGLQQVGVNSKTGLSFGMALRSFLRADPDVILVGEMRDKETAEIAVHASMTGHLVMSSLHANSAAETINRLRSLGIPGYDLADSLRGIVSQRLLRTPCQKCATTGLPEPQDQAFLENLVTAEQLNPLPSNFELTKGQGCNQCDGTGYSGRIGIQEVLTVDRQVNELILKNASSHKIVDAAADSGYQSLVQDGVDKLFAGRIDIDELKNLVA